MRLVPKWSAFILFVLCFFTAAGSVEAFKISNVTFPDFYSHGEEKLHLRGAGLKKFLTIRVVAVGLYLPKNVASKDVLTDVPKRIEVVYLQNIPSTELKRATTEGIRDNVSAKEFEKLMPQIEELNAFYPSVNKMDRIQVTYTPGQGILVEVNGKPKGFIKGNELGRAFFAIWVGDNPVDPRIKQLLLGVSRQIQEEV